MSNLGRIYRHLKRKTIYGIVAFCQNSDKKVGGEEFSVTIKLRVRTAGDIPAGGSTVLYIGDDGQVWARWAPEFFDGRFERVGLAKTVEVQPKPAKEITLAKLMGVEAVPASTPTPPPPASAPEPAPIIRLHEPRRNRGGRPRGFKMTPEQRQRNAEHLKRARGRQRELRSKV